MGWSLLYATRADFVCFKSRSGTHESSSAEYPFHWIRNERLVGVPWWHRIFLISYSSSPLIRSGGGDGNWGCGWHFHDEGIGETHGKQGGFSTLSVSGVDR